MGANFDNALAKLQARPPLGPQEKALIGRSVRDTLGVLFSGWHEQATHLLRSSYGIASFDPLQPPPHIALEGLAGIYATAIHAWDFDDVHPPSRTHPSVVILAPLLAAAYQGLIPKAAVGQTYALGFAVLQTLFQHLGTQPYLRGWHYTSIFGSITAAVSLGSALGLTTAQLRRATALAATQAAGMQCTFGTILKAVQVGYAVAAGVRAVNAARSATFVHSDIFSSAKGFLDLYGESGHRARAVEDMEAYFVKDLVLKPYPTCYMSHKPIVLALKLFRKLAEQHASWTAIESIKVRGLRSEFSALTSHWPQSEEQAQFAGEYLVACAIVDGNITLTHLKPTSFTRDDLKGLYPRIAILENAQASGTVTLQAFRGKELFFEASVADQDLIAAGVDLPGKVADCLSLYNARAPKAIEPKDFDDEITHLLGGLDLSRSNG